MSWKNNIYKIHNEFENFVREHLKKRRILISFKEKELVILLFHPLKAHSMIDLVSLSAFFHKLYILHKYKVWL